MSRLMISLFVAAGLAVSGSAAAQMNVAKHDAMSKETHAAAKTSADAQFKLDKEACASMADNAKDICMAQARGKQRMAVADADAAYNNTAKSRSDARVAHAQAAYDVAHEKCDDLSGNRKDVCVKEAKAELVKGKANAKVDRVVADTREDAAAKQADVRKDADADKREADYKVAVEKCDALAGGAKDSCIGNAKTHFGKS